MAKKQVSAKLRLVGLTCAHCAAKIEREAEAVKGVQDLSLNFSTSLLSFKAEDEDTVKAVIALIKKIAPHVEVKIDEGQPHSPFSGLSLLKKNWHLIGGGLLFVTALLYPQPELYVLAYLLSGYQVLKKAASNMLRGQLFDENFLMVIATIGALALGEYPEAIAVMLFYEIGELFQFIAVNKSRTSISSLLDLRVDSAHVVGHHGIQTVPIDSVKVGAHILVKPGERVPLDGVILEGEADLDLSALTGESQPKFAGTGSEILSGAIVVNGALKVQVRATSKDSTVARILQLVENASEKKSKSERFMTRFSRYYTPVVVGVAFLVAVVPPLFLGGFGEWLYRALVFLVVSCPCALVVSIPLAWFAGIGAASRDGVLVKGANYLEMLQKTEVLVFDKTGTLTKGEFAVKDIRPVSSTADELLKWAACAESQSNHPIAKSIVKCYGQPVALEAVSELAGKGVRALVDGRVVLVGTAEFVGCPVVSDAVHVSLDGEYAGYLILSDEIKPTSATAINRLKADGVKRMVMLTGDQPPQAKAVAEKLGIKEFRAGLLPHEKVAVVEALLGELPPGSYLAFIGDGINDAPVLARSDIGIAMGGLGSDAAIEAADVVLMKDDLLALVAARIRSRQTVKILYQNIAFAIGIKVLVMVLSLFGFADLWLAVFADVGVTVLTILNSIRILRK